MIISMLMYQESPSCVTDMFGQRGSCQTIEMLEKFMISCCQNNLGVKHKGLYSIDHVCDNELERDLLV